MGDVAWMMPMGDVYPWREGAARACGVVMLPHTTATLIWQPHLCRISIALVHPHHVLLRACRSNVTQSCALITPSSRPHHALIMPSSRPDITLSCARQRSPCTPRTHHALSMPSAQSARSQHAISTPSARNQHTISTQSAHNQHASAAFLLLLQQLIRQWDRLLRVRHPERLSTLQPVHPLQHLPAAHSTVRAGAPCAARLTPAHRAAIIPTPSLLRRPLLLDCAGKGRRRLTHHRRYITDGWSHTPRSGAQVGV